eukprot:PhM_4_TR15782/c0_g1_i1/m.100744
MPPPAVRHALSLISVGGACWKKSVMSGGEPAAPPRVRTRREYSPASTVACPETSHERWTTTRGGGAVVAASPTLAKAGCDDFCSPGVGLDAVGTQLNDDDDDTAARDAYRAAASFTSTPCDENHVLAVSKNSTESVSMCTSTQGVVRPMASSPLPSFWKTRAAGCTLKSSCRSSARRASTTTSTPRCDSRYERHVDATPVPDTVARASGSHSTTLTTVSSPLPEHKRTRSRYMRIARVTSYTVMSRGSGGVNVDVVVKGVSAALGRLVASTSTRKPSGSSCCPDAPARLPFCRSSNAHDSSGRTWSHAHVTKSCTPMPSTGASECTTMCPSSPLAFTSRSDKAVDGLALGWLTTRTTRSVA